MDEGNIIPVDDDFLDIMDAANEEGNGAADGVVNVADGAVDGAVDGADGDFVPRHTYEQLHTDYTNLREIFTQVCGKYDIDQCRGCGKYRHRLVKCPCGKAFCSKCKPSCSKGVVALIYCDKCKQMTCGNCSIDVCSICNGHVCRRPDCIAYVCDGSLTGNCRNIICCDCRCKFCALSFCGECMPGHNPCAPKLCSCGHLVYKAADAGYPEYPMINCKLCGVASCDYCYDIGARHRARHSIIPFIIANIRGDLPLELPPEIVFLIWEHLCRE